jgi:Leucine-rich repeat (LRR) protein
MSLRSFVRFLAQSLVFASLAQEVLAQPAAFAAPRPDGLRFVVSGRNRPSFRVGSPHRPGDERSRLPARADRLAAHRVVPANTQDSLILRNFYLIAGGSSWTERQGWLSAPVADWHGVTLDAEGRVATLVLSGNNLAGPLPPTLGQLDSLTILDLSNNLLIGPLPEALGSLSRLVDLRLWGNALNGTLPASLGNLTALEELWLFDNDFEGAIPESLGGLGRLRLLYLDQNRLSGTIPTSLGNLTTLTDLFLDFNALTGPFPPELGQLVSLQTLFLGDNDLSGPLPATYSQLSNLLVLSLSNTRIDGPFPRPIYDMGRLTGLFASKTGIAGPLSDSLYALTRLIRVHLDHNALTGSIPPLLGFSSIDIRELLLGNNALTGPLPASLGNLGLLEWLDVSGNDLSDDLPSELGFESRMRYLYLGGNAFTGPIPDSYAGMTLLTQFDAGNNRLSGLIPEWLGDLPLLDWLNLGQNVFSGPIPERLGNAPSLQLLSLWQNQLEGPVPASLGGLRSLQFLDLGSNLLSGPLPESIGDPPELVQVLIDKNTLEGTIPASLARRAGLQVVQLDDNRFSGAVPAAFNDLTGLQRFTMAGNRLHELPDLSGMTGLETLDVRSNLFTFEDIEPNIGLAGAGFFYSPQAPVLPFVDLLPAGTRLSVRVGGAQNTYQWYRNDEAIEGATQPALLLSGALAGDRFVCRVANTAVTGLVIESTEVTGDVALAGIAIAPDSATVVVGDTLVFEALGMTDAGQPVGFTPRWSATGGAIDSLGRFVAGTVPGAYAVTAEDLSGTWQAAAQVVVAAANPTSREEGLEQPWATVLVGAYPNPFVERASVFFDLVAPGPVRLTIYDLLGRIIRPAWEATLPAGRHELPIDGDGLSAGVYLYRVELPGGEHAATLVKAR